jgi:hypothetical protein
MDVETQPVAPMARPRTSPTKRFSVLLATLRAVLSVRGIMARVLVWLLFALCRWRLLLEPPPPLGGLTGKGRVLFERDPDAGDRSRLRLGGGR